jgi:ectoine hydroxylase-related dioxygenase (phytanoyl-CoA dioxygenase family)
VLDIIESLVGPDIQHHHSKLNWKPPLPPGQAAQGWKIGWHQDYAFFPHTNYDLPACAIYLDDTNLENGCMRVIPGGHRGGPRNHMKDGAFSGVCQEPEAYADESQWRTVEVPAGGISLHHCLMLHSSAPNHSQRARRTFVIQYRAADNVQIAGRTSHLGWGFQVRGQNQAMLRFENGVTCPLPEGLTSH